MTTCCFFWQSFVLYNHLSFCMTICSFVWYPVAFNDILWFCKTIYSFVWQPVILYDNLWFCRTTCCFASQPVVLYGDSFGLYHNLSFFMTTGRLGVCHYKQYSIPMTNELWFSLIIKQPHVGINNHLVEQLHCSNTLFIQKHQSYDIKHTGKRGCRSWTRWWHDIEKANVNLMFSTSI